MHSGSFYERPEVLSDRRPYKTYLLKSGMGGASDFNFLR